MLKMLKMLVRNTGESLLKTPNHAINSDEQKRRFALRLLSGYGERYASQIHRQYLY